MTVLFSNYFSPRPPFSKATWLQQLCPGFHIGIRPVDVLVLYILACLCMVPPLGGSNSFLLSRPKLVVRDVWLASLVHAEFGIPLSTPLFSIHQKEAMEVRDGRLRRLFPYGAQRRKNSPEHSSPFSGRGLQTEMQTVTRFLLTAAVGTPIRQTVPWQSR